jgi:hypothetical protein
MSEHREELQGDLDALRASLEPARWDLLGRYSKRSLRREAMIVEGRSAGGWFAFVAHMSTAIAAFVLISYVSSSWEVLTLSAVLFACAMWTPMLRRAQAYRNGYWASQAHVIRIIWSNGGDAIWPSDFYGQLHGLIPLAGDDTTPAS